jgi:hypothetical protein
MTKTNVSLPLVEDPTNPSNLTQEQFVQYSLSYADMLFEPFDLSPEPASIRFGHHSITYGNTNLSTIVQGTYSNSTPAGQLPISQFFMLGIPPTSFADFLAAYTLEDQIYTLSPAKLDPLVVAYNCSFQFCLQAIEAQTMNGVTQQKCLSSWERMRMVRPSTIDASGAVYPSSGLWEFTEIPPNMNVANSSAYQIDFDSFWGLASAFMPILNGKVAIDLYDGDTTFNSDENITGIGSATEGLQAFWSASASVTSTSALCQRIANGFTMYMRNSMPAAPDARYASTVYADATFVHVRWGWLAFPLSLLLAGHIFLFTTIWHTRRLRTRPWKGHRIPLLLASIDDVVKDTAAGGLDSRTGLEERVGRFKVRLEYDDGDEIVFKRVV